MAERSALFGHIFMCTYYCDNPHYYVILTLDTDLGFKYLWTTVQFRGHSSNDTTEIHMGIGPLKVTQQSQRQHF